MVRENTSIKNERVMREALPHWLEEGPLKIHFFITEMRTLEKIVKIFCNSENLPNSCTNSRKIVESQQNSIMKF